jgi:hypothetical protein
MKTELNMKKKYFIIIFLIFSSTYSQSVKKLLYELSYYNSGEKYGDKINIARKVLKTEPFNENAIEYVCRYYTDRQIDSVNYFFDNIIKEFPNKSEPYILKSKFLSFQSITLDSKILKESYLLKAIEIEPNNLEANYLLGKLYYDDFLFPYYKIKKTTNFDFEEIDSLNNESITFNNTKKVSTFLNPAEKALFQFYKIISLKSEEYNFLYYPITQIENYLSIKNNKIELKKNTNSFFQIAHFSNLNESWETDLSVNYIQEIESSKNDIDWLSVQLINLKEKPLYEKDINPNSEIYRFTWLRSFDNPISVRIENIQNVIKLYWSVGKGKGGYEPKGIKIKRERKISLEQWLNFKKLVNESKYENLPNDKYVLMTDGATWTLENKTSEKFLAKKTNFPNSKFKESCLYLIDLTKLKINRIY